LVICCFPYSGNRASREERKRNGVQHIGRTGRERGEEGRQACWYLSSAILHDGTKTIEKKREGGREEPQSVLKKEKRKVTKKKKNY